MKRRLVFGGCGIFGLRQIVSRFLFLLLCSPLLSLFFLVILFISDPSFLSFFYFWFFVWEELVDEFDCETNKIIV